MHKLMQFLAVGFVVAAVSNVGTLAQADHWYVPGGNPIPVYSEPHYSYPTSHYSQPIYGQPIYGQPIYSRPAYVTSVTRVTRSSVIVAQPVVMYAEPVYVESVPVYVEPVVVTHRVFMPAPVYSGPVVSSPYKVREEIKSRPGHYEYEQKGKFQVYNEGMRPRTYRYEYEVDQRYGRTKTKFDIRD